MFRNITQFIDVPDLAFWVFLLGFVIVCWKLRQRDKREGYPLRASPFNKRTLLGFPAPLEPPHIYRLHEGGTTSAPHHYPQPPTQAKPLYRFDGTPFCPVGNPLIADLGPGAWVMRKDEPMLTEKGELMLQPLRNLPAWRVAAGEAEPRGMQVLDCRWRKIGVVIDIWADCSSSMIRLFEIELLSALGGGHVLVPIYHTDISKRDREIRVMSLTLDQFRDIPMPAEPDRITAREEERLNAYFAAGRFYRDEPLGKTPVTAAL